MVPRNSRKRSSTPALIARCVTAASEDASVELNPTLARETVKCLLRHLLSELRSKSDLLGGMIVS